MLVLLYPIQNCSNYSGVGNKLIKVLDKVWQKNNNNKKKLQEKSQTSQFAGIKRSSYQCIEYRNFT